MPDFFFASETEVPEELRGALVKDDATGKLKINLVPNAKLKEFRDNNLALAQERDRLKELTSRVTPVIGDDFEKFTAELAELRELQQKAKDGTLKTTDAIQKEVETRVKSMEETYRTQLSDAAKKLKEKDDMYSDVTNKFQSSVRDREITNAILSPDSGVNPQALPDILSRAARVFQVTKDGALVPKNGDTIIYGADAATPMTPTEWLAKLLEEAPYLGKSSAGSGATGGGNDNKFGGMSQADFEKMTPARRMQMHRDLQKKRA